MTQQRRTFSLVAAALLLVAFGPSLTSASDGALLLIERSSGADRNTLIAAGVTLVAETDDAFLAVGERAEIEATAAASSLAVTEVDANAGSHTFALVGLRPGWTETDLLVCGEVVARGDDWRLVRGIGLTLPECVESPGWFLRVLDMEPLAAVKPPPAHHIHGQDHKALLVPDPLVQEMVDRMDVPTALAHWSALSESPYWTTRHSSSQGCVDAAAYIHDLFTSLGLQTESQHHTSGYADNVIGTLPGITDPDKVYIAIGHLDDLPSSGPAPGADDNASGTAMVTALAEVMSDYCFASTVKFLAVTGEEQGLHGSDHYADLAAAMGEDIQAVLNGDMIGWEGDGYPAEEDLDVNYNSGSQWLAQAMVDAAADYSTGIAVNAFSCSSMTYSDHAPFWSNGFSAICGITDNEGFCGQGGNYPFYHQSSDTITNCGTGAPAFEAAAIRTYLATLAHLAQPIARIPDPPADLNAQPDGDNRIALSWTLQDPGIEYHVYRAVGGCADPGPPTFIGQTTAATFVDTTASASVPYGYTVMASTAGNCMSAVSDCAEATTTGVCTEPPSFVGADDAVNAATSNCRLTVQWQPPDEVWCGGPVVYNVYRATDPDFTPSTANRVASQISPILFDDFDVVSFEDYHYIVRAVDLAHGAEDVNTNDVKGSPTGPAVIGTWTDDAGDTGDASLITASPWSVASGAGVSGAAYATGHYPSDLCAAVTTEPMLLDVNPQLEFWSKYDIENGWDKGELQILPDGAQDWERVPMAYPGSSGNDNDECDLGTGSFFTGTDLTYDPYTADLSNWAGQEVRLRWVLSSDGYIEDDGWWIDDLSLTDVAVPGMCYGADMIFIDGFESGDTSAWSP
jgi:hypothetical protein